MIQSSSILQIRSMINSIWESLPTNSCCSSNVPHPFRNRNAFPLYEVIIEHMFGFCNMFFCKKLSYLRAPCTTMLYSIQIRQEKIKPMVEDFWAWVKKVVAECRVMPQSKTGEGLNFIINQEKYLKVFLENGDVPIDNSTSERSIRTFCLGKKNWMFHNTARGASASALVYSIAETAKINNLRPYYYFKYILSEMPKYCDNKGKMEPDVSIDYLMPWSETLPEKCRKPHR